MLVACRLYSKPCFETRSGDVAVFAYLSNKNLSKISFLAEGEVEEPEQKNSKWWFSFVFSLFFLIFDTPCPLQILISSKV